jgi:hypothetical protein
VLTVAIMVNGEPIYARSAVRVEDLEDNHGRYEVDDGSELVHDPDEGAVELAEKLLQTIDEPGENR